jgi:hypothetical protein
VGLLRYLSGSRPLEKRDTYPTARGHYPKKRGQPEAYRWSGEHTVDLFPQAGDIWEVFSVTGFYQAISSHLFIDYPLSFLVDIRVQGHCEQKRFENGCTLCFVQPPSNLMHAILTVSYPADWVRIELIRFYLSATYLHTRPPEMCLISS